MGDMARPSLSFHVTPLTLDLQADSLDPPAHKVLRVGAGIAVNDGPYLFATCLVFYIDRRFESSLLQKRLAPSTEPGDSLSCLEAED